MVFRQKITLLFHVDDVLLTHKSANIVTDHIKMLDRVHGQKDPLNVTREKVSIWV